MSKLQFKCICGHVEEVHNFDPDSAFFGCMYTILIVTPRSHKADTQKVEVCRCDEFRPDNLVYLEERYARKNVHSRLHR